MSRTAPYAAALVLLAAWEAAVRLLGMPAFILPAPSQVAAALWELRQPLFLVHLPVTLAETLAGLGISVVAGVGLAVGMHVWAPLRRALYPLVVASQTVPTIAISPLFLLWFGYTFAQKVAVTLLITFFFITVNTFDGLRSTDPELRNLLVSMGAGRWRIFRMAELPAAMPLFFTGLRTAAAVAVVGATIGEWLGGEAGLGYFGRRMTTTMRAAPLFASVALLSLLGIALFWLVGVLERRVIAWHHRGRARPGPDDAS